MSNLNKYNKKRNFNKTKEPIGKSTKSNQHLKFVVQHHEARKDHYDLRLEWKGTMKSWAVVKGPSYNTSDRRLAVMVEDHPLQYRNFEGTIPKGEYGGGTVMIWDEGSWEPLEKPDFNKQIKFTLKGKRLKGSWVLVHYKNDNWLLIKEKDDYKLYDDINEFNKSIRSGKTMDEIRNNIDNIDITNPDKVIFEKQKITKMDIINYYKKVANRMIPLIENRLITTVRCPNGYKKGKFFKKHFESVNKFLGKKVIKNSNYFYIKDISGLIKEVQMNSYEFHIWGSKVNKLEKPDIMIFDFDPDENLDIKKLRQGVKDLKQILDKLGIKSFLKTSGGKGYHVVCKIESKNWIEHSKIAKDIAILMETKWPDRYTSNIRKSKRKGRIFVDWVRNTKSQTSVAPYSIRLKESAAISMPIKWSELDKVKPDEIKMEDAIKRLKRKDPWEDFN